MKNSIYKVDMKQLELILKELQNEQKIHVAVVDGKKIQSWNTFLDNMIEKFSLPMKEHKNVNAYLDWMTDLDWLNKDGYVLIIKNSKEFMTEDFQMKRNIINDFKEHILPFWESEVEQVVVGGKAKRFDVYLN